MQLTTCKLVLFHTASYIKGPITLPNCVWGFEISSKLFRFLDFKSVLDCLKSVKCIGFVNWLCTCIWKALTSGNNYDKNHWALSQWFQEGIQDFSQWQTHWARVVAILYNNFWLKTLGKVKGEARRVGTMRLQPHLLILGVIPQDVRNIFLLIN